MGLQRPHLLPELLILLLEYVLVVLDFLKLALGGFHGLVANAIFRVPMSFHTCLVVTRPEFSDGVKASPLRVR